MPDEDKNALEVLADAAGGLPAPISTALLSSLSRLLGGVVAIPAAWLHGKVQAIEDATRARSRLVDSLTRSAGEKLSDDETAVVAAIGIWAPKEVRKAANLAQVARRTVEHVHSHTAADGASDAPREPKPDWFNFYTRFAEDATSEELQDLFARILAGEITRPGAFSITALRIASEMDSQLAQDFAWFWGHSIGDGVPTDIVPGPGIEWQRVTRLRDAGLVSPVDSATWQPAFSREGALSDLGSPWHIGPDGLGLIVWMENDERASINRYNLTEAGSQLTELVTKPDYKANLIKLAKKFQRPGVRRITWLQDGRLAETIYGEDLNTTIEVNVVRWHAEQEDRAGDPPQQP